MNDQTHKNNNTKTPLHRKFHDSEKSHKRVKQSEIASDIRLLLCQFELDLVMGRHRGQIDDSQLETLLQAHQETVKLLEPYLKSNLN